MSNGEIVYDDDPSIEAGDPVWRRIPPGEWTFDHNEGRVRPTSKNFQYSRKDKETGKRHPMSVTLAGVWRRLPRWPGNPSASNSSSGLPVTFGIWNWASAEMSRPTSSLMVSSSRFSWTARGSEGPTFQAR